MGEGAGPQGYTIPITKPDSFNNNNVCTVYIVHCTLYSVHCTLYTVHKRVEVIIIDID